MRGNVYSAGKLVLTFDLPLIAGFITTLRRRAEQANEFCSFHQSYAYLNPFPLNDVLPA